MSVVGTLDASSITVGGAPLTCGNNNAAYSAGQNLELIGDTFSLADTLAHNVRWNGEPIADPYIASAPHWNAYDGRIDALSQKLCELETRLECAGSGTTINNYYDQDAPCGGSGNDILARLCDLESRFEVYLRYNLNVSQNLDILKAIVDTLTNKDTEFIPITPITPPTTPVAHPSCADTTQPPSCGDAGTSCTTPCCTTGG